jgi:hypothetical protein
MNKLLTTAGLAASTMLKIVKKYRPQSTIAFMVSLALLLGLNLSLLETIGAAVLYIGAPFFLFSLIINKINNKAVSEFKGGLDGAPVTFAEFKDSLLAKPKTKNSPETDSGPVESQSAQDDSGTHGSTSDATKD